MDIQIIKFRLSSEESSRALPIVMGLIAGHSDASADDFLSGLESNATEPGAFPEPITAAYTEPVKALPPSFPKVEDLSIPAPIKKRRWRLPKLRLPVLPLSPKWCSVKAGEWWLVVIVGLLIGSVGAWLLVSDSSTEVKVEPAPVTESQPEAAPIAPPGDASDKSGIHGDRPPMSQGALE